MLSFSANFGNSVKRVIGTADPNILKVCQANIHGVVRTCAVGEVGPQNYSKALEHYSKAIQLKPRLAETYEYRGVLFAKMGRKTDAQKDLAILKKFQSKVCW